MEFRIIAAILSLCPLVWSQEANVVTEKIDLLADPKFSDFTVHLNAKRSLTDQRDEVWNLKEGELHATGKGWGYLRTNEEYRDYHLVLEYQWAERTYGNRADRARDGGVLVHGYGEDGAFADMFLSAFQAQLIEGGTGDLIALAARDASKKTAPTTMTAHVKKDRDGEPVWNPQGAPETFPAENSMVGRVNWKDRDPDWRDVKGYRGANDIENPPGEWNRLEVICKADRIQIRVNGVVVNEAYDVSPSAGYVCLQSEYAEMRIRRWELWPIDQFTEVWKEEFRSTDTGYRTDGESILPRRFPLSPAESKKAWHVAPGYEMQLVASEPVVCDPVDVVWDEKGQMFVAEMGDYPLPAGEGGFLSRIRLLSDENGDGIMDKAVTWAGDLDHVQGLLPMDGGLVATTRTAILFLKDTDGDGVADVRRKLFEQNAPRHNQLQVSSPRWGLDNAIYFNNGLDLNEIYPVDAPDDKINAKSRNLRYDPYNNTLTAIGGRGQFGATVDNWNHRFFSTNRNPLIFAVMSLDAASRNPFAAITQVQEDIEEAGAKLRPVKLSHTTSVAHAGTYTAACGTGLYRGNLMPNLAGNLFVCDPTAQVVTCAELIPAGASFSVKRKAGKHEFLASGDDWARPVNICNGPDGALYICDMYRRFIDHARFFPEEFAKSNYMRAGLDHGRIWRLVPKGLKGKAAEPLPDSTSGLVGLLESENGWHRVHAHRLLMERGETEGVNDLLVHTDFPEAFAHAMWILQGQNELGKKEINLALKNRSNGVVENALQLIEAEPYRKVLLELAKSQRDRASFLAVLKLGELEGVEITGAFTDILYNTPARKDPWMRKAVLSGSKDRTGAILAEMLKRYRTGLQVDADSWDNGSFIEMVKEFATVVAARGDAAELDQVLAQLKKYEGKPLPVSFALAEGLSTGLRRSRLKQKTLAALISSPPESLKQYSAVLQDLVDRSGEIVVDRSRSNEVRLAALPLAAQQGQDATLSIVEKLIEQSEPVEIQQAACQALTRFKREDVAEFFFARWDGLAPTPRREALNLIATNSRSAILLMKKMKAGEIPASIMPPMQRWSFGRSSNEEIKSLATELFGKTDNDRAKVVADYQKAIKGLKGDPVAGKQVFQKGTCFTCHKKGEMGVDVGPSLADVKIKPDGALLTDILDPNRAVEERWAAYQIETKSGQNYAGLVAAETGNTVEIRVPGGHSETIPRDQITKTTSTGLSLMPVGLEAAISKQEMADLLAFLKQ
ncbi:MAG: DUF1080 domain-containing protein [Verrucomicrobiales bacterium]|nr:DUF1080 domain-containing protein [Verrucomicrobiales bacterium]